MTDAVLIRPVRETDIAPIQAIYADEVLHRTATFELEPPDEAEMARRIDATLAHDLPWVVAEVDGVCIGYAYLAPFRLRPAYRYSVELSVYLRPDQQRRGIGRRLMQALIDEAAARGLRHLIGVIGDSENTGSIALHAACGFRDAGVWRGIGWKFDRWIDVVLMQLDLNPSGTPPVSPGLSL